MSHHSVLIFGRNCDDGSSEGGSFIDRAGEASLYPLWCVEVTIDCHSHCGNVEFGWGTTVTHSHTNLRKKVTLLLKFIGIVKH